VLVLGAGTVLRSLPWAAALFAGTVGLGAAIAVANTLLPVLVKENFSARLSAVTGLYVATMGLGATLASGVAVPLAGAAPAGWHTAAGCWAVLAVPAAALWLPQLRRPPGRGVPTARPAAAMPWRSPLAWQVTVFMGLQSLGFYVMVGWLPSLLRSHGTSAHAAGWLLALYQSVNLLVSLTLPVLIDRTAGQRAIASGCALFCAAGYTGLILAPSAAALWVIVAGLGTGGCFVLALSFMALRAGGGGETAALSAMAQSIGYLLAAAGPVLFGFLRDASRSWTPSLLMLLATALLLAAVGQGAGRPARVAPR
jgi:MFS transporter, CP family, cyanate transporter